MRAVKEKAPAKINLYLNVTAKREDGFHEIETVMHTVSLCDELTVTLLGFGKRGVTLILDGNKKLPIDNKNIAYAAAKAFLDRAGIDAEVEIKLKKRIPIAAGLAGGSSDAAAVLRGMNKLFSRPLTTKALLSVAAELGSDVPYCVIGGTCLCRGRGELIERLSDGIKLFCVVAVANEHVSTPMAYNRLDEIYSDFKADISDSGRKNLDGLLNCIKRGEMSSDVMYNIFESAVLPLCEGASDIKEKMIELGASASMMSGSGPSVFGVFDSEQIAQKAATQLSSLGYSAFYACTV